MYDNATNVIRGFCNDGLSFHSVLSKKTVSALFHTNANKEVPCSLSARNTALESSKNKLKSRPYCILPRLSGVYISDAPNPTYALSLQCTKETRIANVAARPDVYLFKCSRQPRLSNVFKEIPPPEFDAGTSLQVHVSSPP